MAMLIAASHGLTTLRISVRPHGAAMAAATEVVTYVKGEPELLRSWWLTSAELMLPPRITTRWVPTRKLPDSFVFELSNLLHEIGLAPSLPLWIHLVKPYGFLGVVDWEGALVAALARPVLRLPDFLERSRENRTTLDVALVCSEPVSEPQLYPPLLLANITGAILRGSRRERNSIHIFADEPYYDTLKHRFEGEPRVAVHDPVNARKYGIQERGSAAGREMRDLANPWLLWIRDSMQGRSLDAVHFVTHGTLADQHPALAFAESPLSNRDWKYPRYVGVGELAAFLTQTGAWSAVFSSPPGNRSEAGLRLLADTLAQTRPGPVVYHRLGLDDVADPQLQALYGFLYASSASSVPVQSDWFAYCQPSIVSDLNLAPKRHTAAKSVDANATLFEGRLTSSRTTSTQVKGADRNAGSSSVLSFRGELPSYSDWQVEDEPFEPSWISAAQRFVEQTAQELQRREERDPAPSAVNFEVERTLQKLQAVVASLADTTLRDDGSGNT